MWATSAEKHLDNYIQVKVIISTIVNIDSTCRNKSADNFILSDYFDRQTTLHVEWIVGGLAFAKLV